MLLTTPRHPAPPGGVFGFGSFRGAWVRSGGSWVSGGCQSQPLARRGRHLIEFCDLLFLAKALKQDIRVVVISPDVVLDVPLYSLHRSGFHNRREVLGLTTAARCLAERRKEFQPAVRLHLFWWGGSMLVGS